MTFRNWLTVGYNYVNQVSTENDWDANWVLIEMSIDGSNQEYRSTYYSWVQFNVAVCVSSLKYQRNFLSSYPPQKKKK